MAIDGGPPTLRTAVTSLQQIIEESATKEGQTSPEAVRKKAADVSFPYPELAAQVFKFLQNKQARPRLGHTAEEISEAFLSLLMDADALEALGGKRANNPWLNVRQVLKRTGTNLGNSLLDVYGVVRKTGLGVVPTILDLANEVRGLVQALDSSGEAGTEALRKLASERGMPPWQVKLAEALYRRRKGEALPTDADLEELLTDEEEMAQLSTTEGPWEIYLSQAETLRILRYFGESLVALGEAAEEHAAMSSS